jgi:hypothetical protein
LRVPSAIALGFGLLVIFDTARRLTDGIYGLIAMSFIATSFVTYFGYEARSYAILFLLASLTLWLWVTTQADSKLAAVAFGVVFFLGMGIHYYMLLCLAPFGIAALLERRIFHPKVIAAATGVMFSVILLYPMIARSRSFSRSISPVWAPSIARLVDSFLEFVPNAILPLIIIAIGAIIFGRRRDHLVPPMSKGERVSWLFVLIPCLAYLMGIAVSHVFHERYVIGAGPGMIVGATCVLWRRCGRSRYHTLVLLLAFSGSAVCQQIRALSNIGNLRTESGDYQGRVREVLAIEDTLFRNGKEHLVFNWDIQYLETWYYSKNRDRYVCLTSEDRWAIKHYVPLHFGSVEEIVANAAQTVVIAPTPDLTEALKGAGLRVETRAPYPQGIVFLK